MTKIQDAKKIIEEADKIVIGAGAGLSAAAGLTYSGSRFEVFFKDYIARYGMLCKIFQRTLSLCC